MSSSLNCIELKMNTRTILLALCCAFLVQADETEVGSNNIATRLEGIDPAAFVIIDGKQYYISPSNNFVTVLEAMRFCNDVGMALLSLETKQKTDTIYEYLDNNGYLGLHYWTSGRRIDSTWQWTATGQLFSHTDWGLDQPNHPQVDVCVFFDSVAKWDDEPCSAVPKRFICQ